MATYEQTRNMAGGHRSGGRLTSLFATLIAAVTEWNDARITRKALSRLSDRQLDDIGLTRGDIDRIAHSRPNW
ncbi:Uncharacterized conserved protein YjiS, DUF1127 family [Meinhardsimonia xiamenensis]|jgi:uncharacterized protein YjiS (DUF1127 family)|uniref:Uncharacterized conserved protein YjiS, DUF1127 family n=1 Tax=Meinhardsimonia xiamenensis TaxID=990712 RepID=A0A1G9CID6_9RHOB|nr:DUF1127 domain-containing protein [Meinhardsimonia xiamenensis]PRX38350.1 uncharacterized protein YjiS (DUF1127 family) [Meinhardsimonia xiamenensis]SDK51410.1 Uncharacterized conserved protein YjiS, DUF1127 family [Meinhardsimonia xiamenensis]